MLNKTSLYGDKNLNPVLVGIAVECLQSIAWKLDQHEYEAVVKRIAYAIQAEYNEAWRRAPP